MTKKLLLFDEIERDYIGPSGWGEPEFTFLNRTARPFFDLIRQTLQEWFDHFEAEEKKRENLCNLFRSDDSREHLSAFFELYLYQLTTRLGFKVDVEPEWPVRSPDFLLTAPTGEQILLEATSSFPDKMFGAAKLFENRLLDEIENRVKSRDFFLHIRINRAIEGNPPYAKICKEIEAELRKLNPDKITDEIEEVREKGLRSLHAIPWKDENWDIEIEITPKPSGVRDRADIRTIGSISGPMERITPASSIKKRINSKYNRYGEVLNIPYLLALNIHDRWTDVEEHVMEALFGTEVTRILEQADGSVIAVPDRELDGAWFESRGFQKTRMSGLIVFKRLTPSQIGFRSPILWHHPAAKIPFNPKLWRLDQKMPNEELRQYEMIQGEQAPNLLKIDREKFTRLASE